MTARPALTRAAPGTPYQKGDPVDVLLPAGWMPGIVHNDDAPRFAHNERKYEVHGLRSRPYVTITSAASMRPTAKKNE